MEKEQAYGYIRDYLLNRVDRKQLQHFLSGLDESEILKVYEQVMGMYFEELTEAGQSEEEVNDLLAEAKMIATADHNPGKANVIRLIPMIYKMAAAAVLLIGTFLLSIWGYHQLAAEQMLQAVVMPGERQDLTLSDGTQVSINNASTFSYPESFKNEERHVALKGEAFFEIARDTLRPFTIHTTPFDIKVLGTSFNVSAYEEDKLVSVSVVSGKVDVMIDATKQHFILTKNRKLLLDQQNKTVSVIDASSTEDVKWTQEIIYFDKTDFGQVARRIERWYDVQFEIGDSTLLNRRISGQHTNKNLEELMETLAYMLDFEYEIDEQKVTIGKEDK